MLTVYNHPEVLALLTHAKDRPEDDGPRLVLADWLDDHGDPGRAEFIRLQCRLAPGAQPRLAGPARLDAARAADDLARRFGGGWLGPLWLHGSGADDWHRGLLRARLRTRGRPAHLHDVLAWVDSVNVEAFGREGLAFAADVLNAGQFNHALLDLRQPFREALVVAALAGVRESACLRTLTLWWPRAQGHGRRPGPDGGFFVRLVRDLAVGRHLTHVATTWPLPEADQGRLRGLGVEAVEAGHHRWSSCLSPAHFRGRDRPPAP